MFTGTFRGWTIVYTPSTPLTAHIIAFLLRTAFALLTERKGA